MAVKEIGLSWIVVKDVKEAVLYYTEVVGLRLAEFNEEYGWAELEGFEGGSRLGIAQESAHEPVKAGQNAVVTFTVANLEACRTKMLAQGAELRGDVIEIAGHVKMQTFVDKDGNCFQICQLLHHSCCHC